MNEPIPEARPLPPEAMPNPTKRGSTWYRPSYSRIDTPPCRQERRRLARHVAKEMFRGDGDHPKLELDVRLGRPRWKNRPRKKRP